MWAWSADHDIDLAAQTQLDVYSGRGILIESQGPLWLYGSASEHCVLYQYQIQNSADVLLSMIQTESPYFQGAPIGAPTPFGPADSISTTKRQVGESTEDFLKEYMNDRMKRRALWKRSNPFTDTDPSFSLCSSDSECTVSWAIRIIASSDILTYGAGLYSWFQNYDQDCLAVNHCQIYLAYIDERKSTRVAFYNTVGVGASVVLTTDDSIAAYARDNINGFAATVLGFFITATYPSNVPDFLGAYGSLLGVYGEARAVKITDPDGQSSALGGSGAALMIVTTSRYQPRDRGGGGGGPSGTFSIFNWWMSYEYWTLQDQRSLTCDDFYNGFDDLSASEPTADGWGTGGFYPTPPHKVPTQSMYDYDIFGEFCKFVQDLDPSAPIQNWDSVAVGGRVGWLHCGDEGDSTPGGAIPMTGIECVKPLQPSQADFDGYRCSGVIYLQTAICFSPANGLVRRGPSSGSSGPGGTNLLYLRRRDIELTPDFFGQTMRRPDLYQPNRQLFYTRRIGQQRGQEGLSDTAVDFALTRRLQTIWEGWPSRRLDGTRAGHYDFYDVRSPNGFLRYIRQTIFTPGREDDTNQNFYFAGMSTRFARSARGIVYVMTEDPLNIPQVGIWHAQEYPTLTRQGTPVTHIIAVDEVGTNWYYIYIRDDPSVTPNNPRRAPPAPPERKMKRGTVLVGGVPINLGGTTDTSPNSYAAICMNDLEWLAELAYCPPPEAEMYIKDYQETPTFYGGADFFG
ncbi:hypothetical protein AA313_de0207710 [Arthrobotrys entomopaga]|nr:hypothetical protein AA313_de0207710 [Arthrobotrys entomopaga]